MARRELGSTGGAKVTGDVPLAAKLAVSVNTTLYFNSHFERKYPECR